DGDRLRRADRLAQLASDAALLAVRIAAQHVLAAEARRERAFLERIVQRRLRLEEIAHRQGESLHELPEKCRARRLIQPHGVGLSVLLAGATRKKCTPAATTAPTESDGGRNPSQPSRISW